MLRYSGFRCSVVRPAVLTVQETGRRFQEGWSMNFFNGQQQQISPWHDIPVCAVAQRVLNVLVEIPKGYRPKLEVNVKHQLNPIMQDRTKDGALRCFTYGDIPFHYGCVPQTYEDPLLVHPATTFKGDGDPLDVVLLGHLPDADVGSLVQAHVHGVLAMIDEQETDWKVIATPVSAQYRDLEASEIDMVRHWFRFYKTTDGKPENSFAFDGRLQDAAFAWRVIDECHHSYTALTDGRIANTKKRWLPPPGTQLKKSL